MRAFCEEAFCSGLVEELYPGFVEESGVVECDRNGVFLSQREGMWVYPHTLPLAAGPGLEG